MKRYCSNSNRSNCERDALGNTDLQHLALVALHRKKLRHDASCIQIRTSAPATSPQNCIPRSSTSKTYESGIAQAPVHQECRPTLTSQNQHTLPHASKLHQGNTGAVSPEREKTQATHPLIASLRAHLPLLWGHHNHASDSRCVPWLA